MSLHRFPNELLLALFAEFRLPSLVAARGVCRQWRNLVPATQHPARVSLLNLYLQIIQEPWFITSRPRVLENLVSFDREAYVRKLEGVDEGKGNENSEKLVLPEGFRIWLLEWPSKAVFGGTWPGLPAESREGGQRWNYLDWKKPAVSNLKYVLDRHEPEHEPRENTYTEVVQPIPAIPVWHNPCEGATWVLFNTWADLHQSEVVQTVKFDEFAASDGPNDLVYRWATWADYLEEMACGCRKTYQRQVGAQIGGYRYPERFKRSYAAWEPGSKPYTIRPLRYL
ncbi:hypothetical protein ONZ45_g6749 [Pleurotus djamor]|nr:hypothetical protein ONZ45_g6749 [Pleurotus djamor]